METDLDNFKYSVWTRIHNGKSWGTVIVYDNIHDKWIRLTERILIYYGRT